MACILHLQGSSAGPFGDKTEHFERHGHEVVGRPRLPSPRYPRRSWRWLVAYLDQRWFRKAVQAGQESFDACRPDIVVRSSMGGAVAMNLASGDTSQVLVAPAWGAWWLLRFGEARRVKPATVNFHGDQDHTIFVEGRLVFVRGEGHRCNVEAALRALLLGVEAMASAS
jgi:hypothetical protein